VAELSGVESDTALTKSGRKSMAMRRMKDVVEENRVLREAVETLKDRLSQAEVNDDNDDDEDDDDDEEEDEEEEEDDDNDDDEDEEEEDDDDVSV
jgi:regulator of replication initiation timing